MGAKNNERRHWWRVKKTWRGDIIMAGKLVEEHYKQWSQLAEEGRIC